VSNQYPRETNELVVFDPVLIDGVPTVAFTYQITEENERPTGAWQTPADAGNGELGFMLVPAPRGFYRVWVKIVTAGQTIVALAGEVERT
jgi:hypothetical protein